MKNPADTRTADLLSLPPLAEHLTANLPTHVESLPDFAPVEPLSDKDLVRGGMAPVQSWMRTERTKNALRVEKCLAKKAAAGVRQLNVQAPESSHSAIKDLARADPETLAKVAEVLAGRPVAPVQTAQAKLTDEQRGLVAVGKRVSALTGWRRSAVLWLLGL